MNQELEVAVKGAEERLREAMLSGDLMSLDALLATDLVFTNHLGQVVSKEGDLAAYRSGLLQIQELRASEQTIRFAGEVAIVSVRVQMEGTYAGRPANGDFRFTRVWVYSPDGFWQVIAAHAGLIA